MPLAACGTESSAPLGHERLKDLACRKDGVSDVIMQSSIVTGSEIGPLFTAQSLI
jgi:hypothetical protein